MFPINFKWVDDIYNKIDSACITLDDIVSKVCVFIISVDAIHIIYIYNFVGFGL